MNVARNPRTAPIHKRGGLDMVVPYHLDGKAVEGVCYAGMANRARYLERSLNGGIKEGFAYADRIDVKR